MRKVSTFLGASLVLAWVAAPSGAQQAPDMFKDVPTDHWAYAAVESLRAKGILIGYPDQYFRGKRTLTRYEFAVALDRALKSLPPPEGGPAGPAGPTGPAGSAGPTGPMGPPGITPEELANFRRLAQEFRDELASLGNSIAAINRRLDNLARQVADIQDQLNKMPKIKGGAFFGTRHDRVSGGFIDRDGRPFGVAGALGGGLLNPAVVHDARLGVMANIPGGATLDVEFTSNNYKNYLGGNTAAQTGFLAPPGAVMSDAYIHHLEVNAPFGGLGQGSKLTVGRFGHHTSRFNLWKPNIDRYFNNPFEDDDNIYMDGLRVTSKFGSVEAEIFGGRTDSVTGTNGPASWSMPLAGIPNTLAAQSVFGGAAAFGGPLVKPFGQPQGAMPVNRLAGVSLGLGLRQLQGGHVRVHAVDMAGPPGFGGFAGFNNVWAFGADLDLKIQDRITLNAEWGKTNTGASRTDTTNASDNNAFNATVGWKGDRLNLVAGYRYIDPLFYAPGYWGWIGNWLNPTNIKGPTFRAAYDFSQTFGVNLGGDFYEGARNRGPGGLTTRDDIRRLLVGLRWDVSRNFRTTIDWEGVYWSIAGGGAGPAGTRPNAGRYHPTEHYVTIGTGYNLTSNTLLRLMYQIGTYDGHGGLGGGFGIGSRYNYNTLASQVAVTF